MNAFARGNTLLATVGGASILMIVLSTVFLRFVKDGLPHSPAAASQSQKPHPRCTTRYYEETLEANALKYNVSDVSVEEMSQPLKGGWEFRGARVLRGRGEALQTPHLRISASMRRISSSIDGVQGFRADHLVLTIKNRTDVDIAYRVVTKVPDPVHCVNMASLRHNVIALHPHEAVQRTECLFHDGAGVTVTEVEAYEVTELGYVYLTRLEPIFGPAFDERVSRWHDPGKLQTCDVGHWMSVAHGEDPWHVLVDFYARHECDEYTPPTGYRPFTSPANLPACD